MSTKQKAACSFCGRSQDEARRLIAGPAAYICDECVRMAFDIVSADDTPKEPQP